MQFQVPQFIEYEPRIIGPFTFKQFVFIGLAGAIGFVLYYTAPFYVFLPVTLVAGLSGLAMAFIKVGGRTLPEMIKNLIHFSFSNKTFIWQQRGWQPSHQLKEIKPRTEIAVPEEPAKRTGFLNRLSTLVKTKSK